MQRLSTNVLTYGLSAVAARLHLFILAVSMASSSDNTPSSMPPRPGSGPGTEIAPQLESVLRNLNVNLEDELARYRRQRHGRVPPPPPPRRAAQRQTIDLISVAASASDESAVEAASQPAEPPPPPPNPFLQTATEGDEVDLPDMEQLADIDAPPIPDEPDQPGPEPDSSSLPVHSGDTPTDGYLESSEELLKSLEEEQAEPTSIPEPYSPERKSNSLLKLAGLVLVVLGGIGVGFAITYPSQLQNLRSRFWPAGDAETTIAETSETETTNQTGNALPEMPGSNTETTAISPDASADGYQPPGPDLSTREFKELDDIKDLVTLDVDSAGGSTAPATSPLPNPAQSPLPNPASQVSDGSTSPTTPAETSSTPAAAPGAAPASPLPTDATGSNFYVIASYTGDDSLNKARELVPDAFVRNFKAGTRIQLAAFDNRAQAEQQVAFLTQQGIVVELFGPTNE